MKMKLVKIVYGYDIDRDRIAARQTFVPSDDDQADLILDKDASEATLVTYYTTKEWEDLLYSLRARSQHVVIKNAAEEL